MSTLPAASYFSNASRTEGEFKTALETFLACAKETPGGAAESELTIASGSVTPTGALHTIDTEGDAASDDLDTLAVTNHPAGRVICVRCANSARVVTLKHGSGGSGQMLLAGDADVELDNDEKHVWLKRVGTDWVEVARNGFWATAAQVAAGTATGVQVDPAALASILQYQHIWIPAAAMTPCTTNGAEASTQEYGANDNDLDVLAFDSGATEERAQFALVMPAGWDRSTVKAKFHWTNAGGASASDTVEWGIKALAIGNDDAIDQACGTAQTVSDVLLAAGDLHITSATGVITPAGSPALGDVLLFEVFRNTDGTDDMTEDAWLVGVELQIKLTNQVAAW